MSTKTTRRTMCNTVRSIFFFIAGVVLTVTFMPSSSSPVPGTDQDLTMHLTVVSGSGTAVPMRGGTVTFRCDIQDYEEGAHAVTWTYFESTSSSWIVLAVAGTLKEPAGSRFLVSRVQSSEDSSTPGNVHQRLVINEITDSDVGLYRCNVMMAAPMNSSNTCNEGPLTLASREMALTVNAPELFPVCTPSSKAPDPLVPGNTLSCGTLTTSRTPVVTRRDSTAGVLEPWTKTPRRDERPGWEVTRQVNASDDGVIYDCWSFPTTVSSSGDGAFSCTIEPHVVTSSKPKPSSSLPVGAIVGIAAGVCVVTLLVLTACICKCKTGS